MNEKINRINAAANNIIVSVLYYEKDTNLAELVE